MRHPIRFAFKVGKNLIVNSGDIIHESIRAVDDWKKEEYEDFGV